MKTRLFLFTAIFFLSFYIFTSITLAESFSHESFNAAQSKSIETVSLPFSDDFENDLANWTSLNETGQDVWHISPDDGIGLSKCARFYITSNPAEANDDWLLSPVFNTAGLNSITISFKYWYHDNGITPEFYYASSFDGTPDNSNWTQLDNTFWLNEWTWNNAHFEIENPGETLVFAVRYRSTTELSNYILIDNISVTEKLQNTSVTFQVDMQNETVSENGVYINGSWGDWQQPVQLTANGSIYSTSLELTPGAIITYKFVNGGGFEWDKYEIPVGDCTIGENSDRELLVPETNQTLDVVCFNTCSACMNDEPQAFNSTFDTDINGWFMWAPDCGTMAEWQNGEAHLVFTSGGTSCETQFMSAVNLQTEKGKIYRITFDARALNPVQLNCAVRESGDNYYPLGAEFNFPITGTTQTYSFDIIASKDCPIAQLLFYAQIGDNELWIDNVYFTEVESTDQYTKVTLRVDMQNETVAPEGVFVKGGWNSWASWSEAEPMVGSGNIYTADINMMKGATIEYVFQNGPTGELITGDCKAPDSNNRIMIVPQSDLIPDVVCFNSCEACVQQPETVDITFQVDMQNETVSPDGVFLNGDWNNWETPTQLTNEGSVYSATVSLTPGETFQYKFLNGLLADFNNYENIHSGDCINPSSGNRELTVPASNATLDLVCFGSCSNCEVMPELINVTFQIDMHNEIVSESGVYVDGDWGNPWLEPQKMTDQGNSIYAVVVQLNPDREYIYAFGNGGPFEWSKYEDFNGPCTDGNSNRSITTTSSDTVVDLTCFNSCEECTILDAPLHTIREIQGEGDVSPYDGQVVKTKGRITGINEFGCFIQDATDIRSGIFVYDSTLIQRFSQGNDIQLIATVSEYNGRTQLSGIEWIDYSNDGEQLYIPFVEVSAINEDYEGVFVGISKLTVLSENEFQEYTAESTDGETIIIDNYLFQPELEIGSDYWIIGIIDYQNASYRINPRSAVGIRKFSNISFQVDMQNETISSNGVFLNGDWNNWESPIQLTNEGSVYSATVSLMPGETYQYKFLNGTLEDYDNYEVIYSGDCINPSSGNRELTVPASDETLNLVCFASCNNCEVMPELINVTFQIDMHNETISNKGVYVDGDWGDPWLEPQKMTDQGNSIYTAVVQLYPNREYLYAFGNGGPFEWSKYEIFSGPCTDGNSSRRITTTSTDMVVDLTCFNSCEACVQQPGKVDITFQVDMKNQTVSPDGVFLNGDWSNWEVPTKMIAEGSVYSATVSLIPGEVRQFKFWNGALANVDYYETIPNGDCINQNSRNRELIVPESNTTLDLVCFGSCTSCANLETPLYTIREIQGEGDISPYDGQVVRTKGRITGINEFGCFIQDASDIRSGIFIYEPSIIEKFKVGNDIQLIATVSEYNGRTQLSEVEWIDYSDVGFTVVVPFVEVSEINEDYEGVFIGIRKLIILSVNEFQEYTAQSDLGETIIVDNYLIQPELEIGSSYMIFGIIDYQYNSYRLNPSATTGIRKLSKVTFQVDMQNETVSENGVFINGSWQDWQQPVQLTANGSIYSASLYLVSGATVNYKFVNGGGLEWDKYEIPVGDCTVGDDNNREFLVPESDITLDAVCFNTCSACVNDEPQAFNSNFDTDIKGWFLWALDCGTMAEWQNGEVHFVFTSGGANCETQFMSTVNLQTEKGKIYRITFDARALNPVQLNCAVRESGDNYYPLGAEFNFPITGTTQTYSFDIIASKDCPIAQLLFYAQIGDNELWIDNVYFTEVESTDQYSKVTLRVDMQNETVAPEGVFVKGGWNSWASWSEAEPMVGSGNIYTAAINMLKGSTMEYKFQNGSTGELITGDCKAPDSNNRILVVPQSDLTLDVVCFNSCEACVQQPETVDITFHVDMQNETVSPDGVFLNGDWNNWETPTQLTKDGSVYSATVSLLSGETFQYKFLNGTLADFNNYEDIHSGNCINPNSGNRELTVPASDATMDLICFGSCEACVPPAPKVSVTFQVDMQNETVSENGVSVNGSWSDWQQAEPLTANGSVYFTTLELTVGETITYKFVNGSGTEWDKYELPVGGCTVGENTDRQLLVPETDITLDLVCFNTCAACVPIQNKVNVTFRVDMQNETVSSDGVFLNGDWNNWETPTQLTNEGSVYSTTVSLMPGETHQFKFLNGTLADLNNYENIQSGGCINPESGNRGIMIPSTDVILDLSCFGTCASCVPPVPKISLTFHVDMQNETVSDKGVFIKGSWDNWEQAIPLSPDGSVYSGTIDVDQNSHVEYNFFNGEGESAIREKVYGGCALSSSGIRFIDMTTESREMQPVCFNSCSNCYGEKTAMKFQVDMQNELVSESGVYVGGSWNDWKEPVKMVNEIGTIYTATVMLYPQQMCVYNYANGGSIDGFNYEKLTGSCTNGTANRTTSGFPYDHALSTICYGTCFACNQKFPPVALNSNVWVDEDHSIDFFLNAYDEEDELDLLTFHLVDEPLHAKVFSLDGRTITYEPQANYYGNDTFHFLVTDSEGNSSEIGTINIAINAVNDRPEALPFEIVANGETQFDFDLADYIQDVETEKSLLKVNFIPEKESILGGTVTPLGGTLYRFETTNSISDEDFIVYRVSDGKLNSFSQVISISNLLGTKRQLLTPSGANILTVNDTTEILFNQVVDLEFLGIDIAMPFEQLQMKILKQPTRGVLSNFGLSQYNGNILTSYIGTYTCNMNANEMDSIVYELSNGSETITGTQYLKTYAVKTAPKLQPIAAQKTNEDEPFQLGIGVSDMDSNLADLQWQLVSVPPLDMNYQIVLENNIPQLKLETPVNYHGNSVVKLVVTDSDLLSDSVSFSLTVLNVNDAPEIQFENSLQATEDLAFNYVLKANDMDKDSLFFSFSALPDWVIVQRHSKYTYELSGLPENKDVGETSFSVSVSDLRAQIERLVSLKVVNTDDPPYLLQTIDTIYAKTNDSEITISLTDYFADDDPGAILSYQIAANSNPEVITANITESEAMLKLIPSIAGTSAFSVEGTSDGKSIALIFIVKVEIPTGSNYLPQSALFEVYPNPVNEILYMKFNSGNLSWKLEVFNMKGQLLYDKIITQPEYLIQAHKVFKTPGNYVIKATSGKDNQVRIVTVN